MIKIFITGATGFVGRQILDTLKNQKYELNILVHQSLPTNFPKSKNVKIFKGDALSYADLKRAAKGADLIINCVGIIEEQKPDITFEKLHVEVVSNLIKVAKEHDVKKIIHLSALGVGRDINAQYFKSKERAEDLIRSSKLKFVIVRPSLIWGNGGFKKQLESIIKFPLITPIIGSGLYKFEPVSSEDIGNIINTIIQNPTYFEDKTYELGGPRIYTLNQLINNLEKELYVKKMHVRIPISFLRFVTNIADKLDFPTPITLDQLRMVEAENITKKNCTEEILQCKPRNIFS